MRSQVRLALFLCLALCVSACGGGGGGSSTHPNPAPSTNGSGGTSGTGSSAQATVTISVHPYVSSQADKRAIKYVAPTTKSATLQVISANGQTLTNQPVVEQDLVSGAAGCTTSSATVTCSTAVPVIVGSVTFAVKTYDQTGAQGNQLGTSLSAATIVANQANRIALTVSGIIANVQLFLAPSSLTPGTASKSLLVVVPQDANGNIIVNPGDYDQPIALSLSSTTTGVTTHVGFEEDGATTPSATATVASPNDQVYVAYDGTSSVNGASVSIVATVPETTPVTAATSLDIGSAALSSSPAGPYLQNAGFAFTSPGQSGSITLSGGTPPYTTSFTAPTTPLSSSRASSARTRHPMAPYTGVASATVSGSTVTVVSGTYGTATLYVSDSAGNTTTFPISVSAPAIAITPNTCPQDVACSLGEAVFGPTTIASVTLNYSGGTGTYSNAFASSGTGTSSCVTFNSSVGGVDVFTNTGACSDLLIVTSGNQTAYFAFIQASGTAGYTIAGTSHAYAPSSGQINILYGGQAVVALTGGNGPWAASVPTGASASATMQCESYLSVIPSNTSTGASPAPGASPAANNSAFVIAADLTAPTAVIGPCTVTFTPTVGSPQQVAAYAYPKMSASPQAVVLHAPGDLAQVTIANAPPDLGVASGIIDVASQSTTTGVSTGVLASTPLAYNSSTGVLSITAGSATGSALVSVHDPDFDEKLGISVTVDSSYASTVPSAIGLTDSIAGSAPSTYTTTAPSWITLVSCDSTYAGCGISSGTLSITPTNYGTTSITLKDAAGGSVTIPITSYSINFLYPGSAIGAMSAEGFPAAGPAFADTVTVTGPSGSFTVTSSSPSVVSVPSTPQTGSFTATPEAAGFATITITDSSNGASISYTASVSTVTIPIQNHKRATR